MNYEASIYDLLFVIPVVLVIAGLGLFIYALKHKKRQWLWWLGLIVIISSSLIVLLMPIIKDYWCINRHDMMEHIGLTIDMTSLDTDVYNKYPLVHILPTGLTWLGASPNVAVGLMPTILYVVYIGAMYLLGRGIYKKNEHVMLLVVCASLLLLPIDGLYTSSTLFIIVSISVLGFCFYTIRCWRWRTIAPFTIVLAIFAGSIIWLNLGRPTLFEVNTGMPLVFPANDAGIVSPFEKAKSYIELAQLSTFDVAWLILKMYAGEIIFGILAVISLVYLKLHNWKYLTIAIAFTAVNLIFWSYFFGWLPRQWAVPHGYTDELRRFIPCFSLILAVPLLLRILCWKHKSYLAVGILLCTAGIFSIFNAYPSPFVYQPNYMVSQLEIRGAKWLIENKEEGIPVAHLGLPVRRFGTAIYGVNWWQANGKRIVGYVNLYPEHPIKVPNHLGYETSTSTIGTIFNEPTYLIITGYDRKLYTEVWKPPIPSRWADKDFIKLHTDVNAKLQYRNDDFEIWLINGEK